MALQCLEHSIGAVSDPKPCFSSCLDFSFGPNRLQDLGSFSERFDRYDVSLDLFDELKVFSAAETNADGS